MAKFPFKSLLNEPKHNIVLIPLILVAEFCICLLIIHFVNYTEIDWVAYMQEVGGYLSGEKNYMNLRGDTGPLVYPAGFVYLYSFFFKITNLGTNIKLSQIIYAFLYVFNLFFVYKIYLSGTRKPKPYHLMLLSVSHRIHSIFVLRLFNDCFAMFLFHIALYLLIKRKYLFGVIMFSLAISIKMNVLVMLPALVWFLAIERGFLRSLLYVLILVGTQIFVAADFLIHFPIQYLKKAFEFDRVFFYKWTVNWKMFSEQTFLSQSLSNTLLVSHFTLLLVFLFLKWGSFKRAIGVVFHVVKPTKMSNDKIVTLFFECNYIAMVCSRSMHYQFYSWYFFTLPWLVFHNIADNAKNICFGVAILFCIEWGWNVFPANAASSTILMVAHVVLLVRLLLKPKMEE
ncbi:hypothetical protein PCE1_003028 [Barthelona sp. PCE]